MFFVLFVYNELKMLNCLNFVLKKLISKLLPNKKWEACVQHLIQVLHILTFVTDSYNMYYLYSILLHLLLGVIKTVTPSTR